MLSPNHLGLTKTFGILLMLVWPKFAQLNPTRTCLPSKFYVASDQLLYHRVCKSWLQKHQKRCQNRENNPIVLLFLETKCCHSNDNLLRQLKTRLLSVCFSCWSVLFCLKSYAFRTVTFESFESFRIFYDFECLQFDLIYSKASSCENISPFSVWTENGSIEVER